MGLVVVSIEGVLTAGGSDNNSLTYEAAVPGRAFYDVIHEGSRLMFLSSDPYRDRVAAWLVRERFGKYADLHCIPVDELRPYSDWKAQHVLDLIGIGHHISFYVDSDVHALSAVLSGGVAVMRVAYPTSLPGRSSGGQSYSPWYDLVDSIEQASLAKSVKAVEG